MRATLAQPRSAGNQQAQIVEELESRSDFDKGPTYAVSVFHGGQWVNCVPMTCTAQALCVAREMDTFHEIGRVIQAVEDIGKLEDTLIVYISGDNGSSPEGSPVGTPNEVAQFNGVEVPVADQLEHFYDVWGSDQTYNHMAAGWTWAFDTPFKWTKQVASHFGGTRQGVAISWPGHITDLGGIRHQFHHVIDIVPTILEVTGIAAPRSKSSFR